MKLAGNRKGVSTLIMIILILGALILGGLLSYTWVISSYYNVPENTTLIAENVQFSTSNFTYFNVTVLNPSYSASDVNLTTIRLTVESKNSVYNINTTEPVLSVIRVGTSQTFKCLENWSPFAGEAVKIEPIAGNASTVSYRTTTPMVKLTVTPNFDAFTSVEYFNLTVGNSAQSILNLTLSDVSLFGTQVTANVTPTLPYVLSKGQNATFKVAYNWEILRTYNVTVTVKTAEGYQAQYVTQKLSGAVLSVESVKFDDKDTTYFNVTVKNSPDATEKAIPNRVNLTRQDNTTITLSTPTLLIVNPVLPNRTLSIKCFWDWNAHRNETVTVRVYTRQGFTPATMTVRTPPATLWNITSVVFDLDHPDYFVFNVTNLQTSLQNINITGISITNGTRTITINQTTPALPNVLGIGESQTFNCTFAWASYKGRNVTVAISAQGGLTLSTPATIAFIKLELRDLVESNVDIAIRYLNVTIVNSANSLKNATINRIVIATGNKTFDIDGSLSNPTLIPNEAVVIPGQNITIVCPWNFANYWSLGSKLTMTVYTVEGIQASGTWVHP